MMTAAACLWLGLFPLLQGGTYAHITLDKWHIMMILSLATLFFFLADAILGHARVRTGSSASSLPAGKQRPSRLPLLFAGLLLLWVVLSCQLGPFGASEWWNGTSVRREGLPTQLCYLGLFFLFSFSRISLKPVLLSAAAGLAVFFVIVLLQRAGENPLGLYPTGRSFALNPEFQGTIGNVDMGTGWLCMLAGLFSCGGLHVLKEYRSCRQKSSLFLASVCAAGLFLSVWLILTMGVQFGVISLSVLLLVTLFRFIPRKWRIPAFLLLLVLVLLAVWFWPGTGGGIWELHEILHGRTRLSFGSNRVAVWYYSLHLARENLLLGSGSDTFALRFNRHLEENALVIPKEQDGVPLPDYFDAAHNEYLAQWLNHGLPAMLFFLLLICLAVWKKRDRLLPLLTPCSAAVLCYAVQAFFSFSVCIVAPLFWILLGISRNE